MTRFLQSPLAAAVPATAAAALAAALAAAALAAAAHAAAAARARRIEYRSAYATFKRLNKRKSFTMRVIPGCLGHPGRHWVILVRSG